MSTSLIPAKSVVTWLTLAVVLLSASSAKGSSDSALELYTSALNREQVLRTPMRPQPPNLEELRVLVERYKEVVRRYPRSSYGDNSLWQASGLSLMAFEHFANPVDRREGEHLLRMLRSEYPSSTLQARVDERLGEFATIANARQNPNLLTGIERTLLDRGVRVTISLNSEVAYRHERLTNPDRVFLDLNRAQASEDLLDTTQSFSDDVVRKIRLGRHPNDITRVVLDLHNVEDYSVFTLYNPYRIVVDTIRGPEAPVPAVIINRISEPVAPAVNANGDFSLSRQLGLGVNRVVIDPGHGGHDPGTRSSHTTEADLVLDIALRLKALLTLRGSTEVVLTRESNKFVSLRDRTAIANQHSADLFLSIHANASTNTKARGIESYVLNFALNPEAEALAARENASSVRTMARLQDLVQTIALNDKLDESREFAEMVQGALEENLHTFNPRLRNLGVKQAPFVVLIGAHMPSVLTEISFLSNPEEAKLLELDGYRQQVAQALFEAVQNYQNTLKNVQVAARP
ncbi:MAG: N-acetylmuramoyl-L-alanine amidase [Acidobacteriota bacterium]|nr:N-acetylmuramoyl-L-alanine amidase [Acidobacteriota bacterium]